MVSSERGVVIKVPYRKRDSEIEQVLFNRAEWIQEKWASLQSRAPAPQRLWVTGEFIFYLGQQYALDISTIPAAKNSCELWQNLLIIRLRKGAEAEKVVERWYRQQAQRVLEARSHYFAALLGVQPKAIIVKQQKSRWGSCDRQNVIRYNWQVIKAAPELLDYLVVHELAHIKEKNHSPGFWAVVASVMPDYRVRRRALRALSIEGDF